MHETLLAILVLLASALVLGALAERLRQSAVIGYLLAGTLMGPNVLGVVQGGERIGTLAELGAATLLFSIGTEFSLMRLRALGARAFLVGLAQVAVTVAAAALATRLAGVEWPGAFAIGAVVSLSSTAVVARLLVEHRAVDGTHGRLAMGVLLTQDLAVVPLVLAVAALAGRTGAPTLASIGTAIGWALALVVVFAVLVRWVFPLLLAGRGMSRNRELVAVFAAVCAIGSALGAYAVGISPALGAFLAGAMLGSSHFAPQVRAEVAPLRTLLVTLFFAAVGLVGDPMWMWQNLPLSMAIIAAILAGKTVLAAAAARAAGYPLAVAVAGALCVAQIGEFSFILAQAAFEGGLIAQGTHALLVTATIGSLLFTPWLVAAADRVARSWHPTSRQGAHDAPPPRGILIIGFGPAGSAAFRALGRQRAGDCLVVDSNPALVAQARAAGAHAVLGDAGRVDTLEHAGVHHARVVLITVGDVGTAEHVAALIRPLAPQAVLVVRSRYHAVVQDMLRAGAHRVVDEETLVGKRLAAEATAVLRVPQQA